MSTRPRIVVTAHTADFERDTAALFGTLLPGEIRGALNSTAKDAVAFLSARTDEVFDKPTPFTRRAFAYHKANGRDGKEQALVYVRPLQAHYLGWTIDGGTRKAGDYATTKHGPVMPGSGAKLTASGNLPRGYVKRMSARKDTWWMKTRRGWEGLFQRQNGKIRTLALIVPRLHVEPLFDWEAEVSGFVPKRLGDHLEAALRQAEARQQGGSGPGVVP